MIRRVWTAAVSIAGAGLFSQFPAFYGHYLQRLGGRLDQARRQVWRIEDAARAEGLSTDGYIQVFLDSAESAHRRQGGIMREELSEMESLQAALDALATAPALTRPVHFAAHLDAGLAEATWSGFAPGLPLTPEGFVYAATGLLTGLLLVVGGGRILLRIKHRRNPA
jgi:hypothetical protein